MTTSDFIPDLPLDSAQPYTVMDQGPFIAIVQWDGTGEFQHWALIPKTDVGNFIAQVLALAP